MPTAKSSVHSKHQSALSIAVFRRYMPSSCLSTFGGWFIRFLFGWSAWELTHTALWVGVTAGLMLGPSFLLSPVFGIISDRINPRNGLLATVSLQALVAFTAGLAAFFGLFYLPCLLILAALNGVVSAAHTPIRLALIPQLVPRHMLASAVGFSAIIFNTSRVVAPAAAAWLITQTSLANTFFTAAIAITAALPFLLAVTGLPKRIQPEATPLLTQFSAGLSYVKSHLGIQLVFAYTLINAFLGRTVIELMPAISGQLLNGSAASLATLSAFAGVGSILGGVIMSRQTSDETRMLHILTLCLTTSAICLIPLVVLNGLVALSAVVLLISLVTTMVGTGSQILLQLLVNDGYRGRVMSLWAVFAMGGPAISLLILGWLVDQFGFPKVLPGLTLLAIIVATFLYQRRGWLSHQTAK